MAAVGIARLPAEGGHLHRPVLRPHRDRAVAQAGGDRVGKELHHPLRPGVGAHIEIPRRPAQQEIPDSTAVFTNETLKGDIFNSVYGSKHGLSVTLKNTTLTGVVSSSNANHLFADGTVAPGGTVFEQDNHWDAKTAADYMIIDPKAYLYAGRLKNTPAPAVNNPVKLSLEDGSVWNVTGTSYLAGLAFSKDSKVCGTITVNGTEVDAPGSYVGEIVVTP